jgi:hypothetical protein
VKRDRSLIFASEETRNVLGMVRSGLTDEMAARACGVTPAHVRDLREAYGEPGPWLIEIALPRGLGAALDEEAARRGVTARDVAADIVRRWCEEAR